MKKIDGKRLKEFMDKKNVQIVDVGPEKDYKMNHIMGSANIPITTKDFVSQVEKKFSRKNQSLVLCSNTESAEQVGPVSKKLEQAGYDSVYQYSADPKDWKNASLSIQK